MNKQMLLNTKNETIEKINNKNELIEMIKNVAIEHYTMCYTNDLNKMDMECIDDLYDTIKSLKNIIAQFNNYNNYFYYTTPCDEYILLCNDNNDFYVFELCGYEFYNICDINVDFHDEITMYKYIISQLNIDKMWNEFQNCINEN